MLRQRDAIIRLLADEDPATVELTKSQLSSSAAEIIPDLRELLAVDNKLVAGHVREVLAELETREAKRELRSICRHLGNLGELENACWLLAQIFLPGLDRDAYQKQLDRWGQELRDRTCAARNEMSRVQAFAQFFAAQLRFRGNSEDYYNVKNSLLPCVIDSRLGIPISLSLIYMFVGRRAGYSIEGVNLPGHFVIRHGNVIFDPFHEGHILEARDCAEIFNEAHLTIHPHDLDPTTPKMILIRVLANLLHIFQEEEDTDQRTMVASWIELLGRSQP